VKIKNNTHIENIFVGADSVISTADEMKTERSVG
jgi:hypothetical protein